MKQIKVFLLIALWLLNMFLMSGCWNYREVDELGIVSGVAIDKGKEKKYQITVEVIELKTGGKETEISSKLIGMEGETIFDAVRDMITITGERLYWSHAKVLVICEGIAREGVIPIADWIIRDAETRADIKVLISKNQTAREILKKRSLTEGVASFELEKMIKNQKSVGKAPVSDVWDFINDVSAKGRSAILPTVNLDINEGDLTQHIQGIAIFKSDKLIGFLEDNEAKYALFVSDEINGGILPERIEKDETFTDISLEIFKSKTKITPEYEDGQLKMKVEIKSEVSIAEVGGTLDFMTEKGKATLIEDSQKALKKNIENVVKKVQEEYGSDIFGFGSKVNKNLPKIWEDFENDWEDNFKDLDVEVTVQLEVNNSAILAKPLKASD